MPKQTTVAVYVLEQLVKAGYEVTVQNFDGENVAHSPRACVYECEARETGVVVCTRLENGKRRSYGVTLIFEAEPCDDPAEVIADYAVHLSDVIEPALAHFSTPVRPRRPGVCELRDLGTPGDQGEGHYLEYHDEA